MKSIEAMRGREPARPGRFPPARLAAVCSWAAGASCAPASLRLVLGWMWWRPLVLENLHSGFDIWKGLLISCGNSRESSTVEVAGMMRRSVARGGALLVLGLWFVAPLAFGVAFIAFKFGSEWVPGLTGDVRTSFVKAGVRDAWKLKRALERTFK